MPNKIIAYALFCVSFAISSQAQVNWPDVTKRMVAVEWPTPSANKTLPQNMVAIGWFIDKDVVVTPGLMRAAPMVDGKPSTILKLDERNHLALLKTTATRPLVPLGTTTAVGDGIVTIYAHPNGGEVRMIKLSSPAYSLGDFLRLTPAAGVGMGGGIFSPDGKLITILIDAGRAEAIHPDKFRSFLEPR